MRICRDSDEKDCVVKIWPRSPVALAGPKPSGLPQYVWRKCSIARYVSRALAITILANSVLLLSAACFPRMQNALPSLCAPPQALFCLFGLVALSWFAVLLTQRRMRTMLRHVQGCDCRICPNCGYCLRGLDACSTCPECGSPYKIDRVVTRWREWLSGRVSQ